MRQSIFAGACALALSFIVLTSIPAAAIGLDPAFHQSLLGPQRAIGVVVWNHGRSIDAEDHESPTPLYLRVLRDSGWDVLRFDRLRDGDTLSRSTERLVDIAAGLKRRGYRHVVLAGQSFGAFLALTAADDTDAVDAVAGRLWRLSRILRHLAAQRDAALPSVASRQTGPRDAVLLSRRRF
jgi:pimeloyl-ACP methyl ester carboxylesterase